MNKAEFIKGIDAVIEGLTVMRNAVAEGDEGGAKAPASKPAVGGAKKSVGGVKAPAKAPVAAKTENTGDSTYTVAELNGMKYNEFKKLASSLGVDCKGTRDEIMSRVIALGVVTDADNAEAATDTKKPAVGGAKSNKSASVGKLGAKKAETPASDKDEFDEKAEAVIAETPVEDIISALNDVGVKATKLNYKKQLAAALREGKLTLEDDEEGDTEDGEAGEEISSDMWFEEFDLSGVNNPDTTSEERGLACSDKQAAIITAINNGELSGDDIVEFLKNNATQEELDLLGDEYTDTDLAKLYMEVSKHFIDEEGNEHEPGEAYMIGENAFCCGQELSYDEATNKFLCSHCAGEYDAE